MTAATQGQAALQYEIDRAKKTGGNAFPSSIDQGDGSTFHHFGMTLRDYFAGKALPSVYSDYVSSARTIGFDEGWMDGVAIDAYEMADAMLKARKEAA